MPLLRLILCLGALGALGGDVPGPAEGDVRSFIQWEHGSGERGARTTAALSDGDLCSALDPSLVVYNRVPKAGSSTMLFYIHKQHKRRRTFINAHSIDFSEKRSNLYPELLQELEAEPQRTLFDRHQFYLNTLEGPGHSVTWVNVVRDPVARIVSKYYYVRFSSRRSDERKKAIWARYGDGPIDDCVALPPEQWADTCALEVNTMTRFFCGLDDVCAQVTRPGATQEVKDAALALAQRNVRTSYAVVGTVERLPETISLLERRLPEYFSGFSDVVREIEEEKAKAGNGDVLINSNPHPKPSQATLATLSEQFDVDIRLYAWLLQRMDAQVAECAATERKQALLAVKWHGLDEVSAGAPSGVATLDDRLCSALDPALVVFNRLTQTNSKQILTLAGKLSLERDFAFAHSLAKGGSVTSSARDDVFVEFLDGLAAQPRRTLWDKNQRFLPSVTAEAAVWFTQLREPTERTHAAFYASRKRGSLTLDECVARPVEQWEGCGVAPNAITHSFASSQRLEDAKAVIKQHYVVVGVAERQRDTLELLARRLPEYFGRSSSSFSSSFSPPSRGKWGGRAPPSATTVYRLQEYSAADYALYEWVKRRMDKQLAACKAS